MPIARFEMPDGKIARFEVAEGTTPEQAQEQIAALVSQQSPELEPSGFPGASVIEPAAAILSGGLAEPAAGIAGIAQSLNPFAEPGAGAEAVEATREALTYEPRTEKGKAGLEAVGETMAPIAGALESAEETLGEAGFQLGGPIAGAVGRTLPTAGLEALGVAGLKGAVEPAKAAGRGMVAAGKELAASPAGKELAATGKDLQRIFEYQSPTKQKIAELIEAESTDIETAPFLLDKPKSARQGPASKMGERLRLGQARVTTDTAASNAIKQGFDPAVIAAVKGASPADKTAFKKMASIMQKGKKNARYAIENRPSNVAGDTLMQRLRVVQKANSDAGKQLDKVAKGLKNKRVEFQPAIESFISDLDDMGIQLGSDLKPNFSGSDIEGLTGPESAINRIVERMTKAQPIDAFELHRMKKFIDEQVTFGKNAEGLAGKTEGVLKKLRRNLDQSLDNQFPEYDAVNTQYSETIGALDAFQDVAGQKMDLTGANADKATGTLMRRIMSNAQSRVRLLDSVNEIESVANKFGGKLSGQLKIEGPVRKGMQNDLLNQILFVDELDSVFGPVARTSFQGQIDQAIKQGQNISNLSQKTAAGAAMEAVKMGYEKVRRINEDEAFKAIRGLLDE